jgi:hypothetical protein
MRPSSTSVSMVFAQIAGWLTVGLLMWLLLLTHNVVGAPLTPRTSSLSAYALSEVAAEAHTPGSFTASAGWPGSAERRTATATRVRSRHHSSFWQAREVNRRKLMTRHTLLGLLLPFRLNSTHHRVEAQRADLRHPERKHYERSHGKSSFGR